MGPRTLLDSARCKCKSTATSGKPQTSVVKPGCFSCGGWAKGKSGSTNMEETMALQGRNMDRTIGKAFRRGVVVDAVDHCPRDLRRITGTRRAIRSDHTSHLTSGPILIHLQGWSRDHRSTELCLGLLNNGDAKLPTTSWRSLTPSYQQELDDIALDSRQVNVPGT